MGAGCSASRAAVAAENEDQRHRRHGGGAVAPAEGGVDGNRRAQTAPGRPPRHAPATTMTATTATTAMTATTNQQEQRDDGDPRHEHDTTTRHRRRQSNNTRKKRKFARARAYTPLRQVKAPSIDYTPVVKADKDRFKFSCPLCFCYFADTILTTSCCGNYICYECGLSHAKQKGGAPDKAKALPERLKGVPCPHCNTDGVQFAYVGAEDGVRSYDTSPATKLRMEQLSRVGKASSDALSTPGRDNATAEEEHARDEAENAGHLVQQQRQQQPSAGGRAETYGPETESPASLSSSRPATPVENVLAAPIVFSPPGQVAAR